MNTNSPAHNRLQLKHISEMASNDWANVPHAQQAAQQGLKMAAALKMVLEFHCCDPWTPDRDEKWRVLQERAGRFRPHLAVTTKELCDTIREVLGEQEES